MVLTQENNLAHDFKLKNQDNVDHQLRLLMGEHGMLLGFSTDVWDITCVRYALWLQRHNFKLASFGINSALIVPNQTYELNGFFMSIPRSINFPLLADPAYEVFEDFGMDGCSGYALVNRQGEILQRWLLSDTADLNLRSVISCLRHQEQKGQVN